MKNDLEKAFSIIDKLVEEQLAEYGTPGIAIGVTDRKELLHLSTFGYSDLSRRVPVSPSTLFEIGSISKSFASIVLLQLLDEGRIALDKPVADYLPWFQINSPFMPITLHHLLSHTAGIMTGTEVTMGATGEALSLRDTTATAEPGTYFHYSNTGYKIVGLIIEKVLGESVPSALKSRILRPLAMNSSQTVITTDLRAKLAEGYTRMRDDRPRSSRSEYVPATWGESDTADGSISSTASDMCSYVRMLLNRGEGPSGRLLSRKSYDLLTQKVIKPADSPDGDSYGYGLNVGEDEGHVIIGHTGGMLGFVASMLLDMDSGFGVVILFNSSGHDSRLDLARTVLRVLRSAAEGKPLEPHSLTEPSDVSNVSDYEGTYRSGSKSLRFVASGTHLSMDAGALVSLDKRGTDEFFAESPDYALFLLRFGRKEGKVVEVSYGPEWYIGESYTGPKAFKHPRLWDAFIGHYRTHNPWISNFRVILRKDMLLMVEPSGLEHPLVQKDHDVFGIDLDERSPEWIVFDMIVEGKATRATLSGCECYRVFTP